MKVLIIQDYLRCGGTEIQSIALTEGFLQNGWDGSLLTFRPGGALAELVHNKCLPWQHLQHLIDFKLNWYAPGLVKYIVNSAPDVVLLMGREANSKANLLREHFPKLTIIGTFRTGRPVPYRYRQSLSACSHIIANSEWAASKVTELGVVDKATLSVIHNGVGHTFHYDSRNEIRLQFRAKHYVSDSVVFLMVASFRRGKNHSELFRIFNHLPGNWELWLVGIGPEKDAFLKTLNKSRFQSQVRDFGQISKLEELYFAADIGILPSKEESLPNFLIESQMCGLPVVAYDCAGVQETFINHQTGLLIKPGDTEEFRNQLLHLMNNPELSEKMGQEARIWAKEQFDPQKRIQDWIQMIESEIC